MRSTSWRRFVTGAAALVLTTALAGPAAAQPAPGQGPGQRGGRRVGPMMPGGPGGPMGFGEMRLLRELNLTDAQRDQVKGIHQQHREEFQQVATQLRTLRKALDDAITADQFNESAIRGAAAKLVDAQADAAVLHAKVRQEVWNVLTQEQKDKAKALKAEWQQRMDDRRNNMQQRFKNRPQGPPQ